MVRTVSIRITGKVQGVWFRSSAKTIADALDISGYVRNMHDGSVYILASGDPQQIRLFVAWCWKGPELARVSNVDVQDEEHADVTAGFEINRDGAR
jgi:acylphosphatase